MNIGLKELAVNAAKASGRLVFTLASGEEVLVNSEMQLERLEKCNGCDYFTGTRCNKCGCFTLAKTKLATEKCPIGRW